MALNDNIHEDRGAIQSRNAEDSGVLSNRNWTVKGVLNTIFEFILPLYTFDSTTAPTFDNNSLHYFDKT